MSGGDDLVFLVVGVVVVLLAAGPTPLRAVAAEEAFVSGAGGDEVAELAASESGLPGYRRALAAELTRRALAVATERAKA